MSLLSDNALSLRLLGCLLVFLLPLPVLSRRFARVTTPLHGPPSSSWLFGAMNVPAKSQEAGSSYEHWAEEYGPVFAVPSGLGKTHLVLCDPKAIQHFYTRETRGYIHTSLLKAFAERLVGHCLFWAESETHRRHRKLLAPAFAPMAVKNLLPVFCDTAHKVAGAWSALLASDKSVYMEVDVRDWMTRLAYDAFGSAGLRRDFDTVCGERCDVIEAVNSMTAQQKSFAAMLQFTLSLVAPIVLKIPTTFQRTYVGFVASLNEAVHGICSAARSKEAAYDVGGRTFIDCLLNERQDKTHSSMSLEEVHSQIKLLLLTGYITTSNCLTWCLVELCRKPDIQHKLRDELLASRSENPTWEELTNELPYLDAVIHETLRLHPPLGSTTRVAAQDDIIPLSIPIRTASGDFVDEVYVAKGQVVTVPIYAMNTSSSWWGADAKEFYPDRFLNEERVPQQIPGPRHILTFVHGQRMCPGRHYAITELKAVLYVLLRRFSFELLDGPDSKVGVVGEILSVPGVPGGDGKRVSLRVRRLG